MAKVLCRRTAAENAAYVRRFTLFCAAAVFFLLILPQSPWAETCEQVVHSLNLRLSQHIDEPELVLILRSLNDSGNRALPPKFVTKRRAHSIGWSPGRDLWSVRKLRGASIGGDRFKNLERKLPRGYWREADLDYHGGHRGGKRIVFSGRGLRFVTTDHYQTFIEVPPCR